MHLHAYKPVQSILQSRFWHRMNRLVTTANRPAVLRNLHT